MSVRLEKMYPEGDFFKCSGRCNEEPDHYVAIPDDEHTRAVIADARKVDKVCKCVPCTRIRALLALLDADQPTTEREVTK